MIPFKEIIEEAKNKAKAQFGEGHYTQTPFWKFILQVEKLVDDGKEKQSTSEKKVLHENYTIERSRNNGEFWSRLYYGGVFSKDEAQGLLEVEHKAHPSDWLRIVKEVQSVECEILGNKKKVK